MNAHAEIAYVRGTLGKHARAEIAGVRGTLGKNAHVEISGIYWMHWFLTLRSVRSFPRLD